MGFSVNSEIQRKLMVDGALDGLASFGSALPGIVSRIRQAQAGPRAVRFDRSGSAQGPISDPTAVAAMRGADLATLHERELDRLIGSLSNTVRRLGQIAELYPVARVPEVAPGEEQPAGCEAGCESCMRTTNGRGLPRWEPVHPNLRGPTTVADRLPEAMRLCSWCWKRVAEWGRIPTVAEVEAHHRGEKLRWPSDVPRPMERGA